MVEKTITYNRIAVSLTDDDDRTLTRLRAKLEQRLEKRLSLSEVVRISLRTQAANEGV